MSERRCEKCGGALSVCLPYAAAWCLNCFTSEPQEGAPDGRPSRDAPGSITAEGSGAPSCDSADWRERMRAALLSGTGHKEAGEFLRMVDELRADVKRKHEEAWAWMMVNAATVQERDELRAKLAEAEQKFETSVGLLNETYDASVKRLEAKLASAETNWESMTEAWERATERAEDAEARVKELQLRIEQICDEGA
jgi:hypothetical protein